MQHTGERNLTDIEKESCACKLLQIFSLRESKQGEWSQYNITRSLKQVHQNVISSSMEERCHGVGEVLM